MTTEGRGFRNNILGFISLVLFLGTVIYLTVEMGRNSRLEDDLKKERLISEAILSEKLLAEKSVAKSKTELTSLQKKEDELQKALDAETEKRMHAENDLEDSRNQAKSSSRQEEKIKSLSVSNAILEKALAQSKTSLNEVQQSNDELSFTARLARDQNTELSASLAELMAASRVTMNEVLIESKKKNSKLTVKANRTSKLAVHLETPDAGGNLSFKIIDPTGKELTDKDGTINVYTTESGNPLSGNTDSQLLSAHRYNRVQMIYSPKHKLKGGLYTIQVANDNRLNSSLQVRLR